jgi:hypothetical protein
MTKMMLTKEKFPENHTGVAFRPVFPDAESTTV